MSSNENDRDEQEGESKYLTKEICEMIIRYFSFQVDMMLEGMAELCWIYSGEVMASNYLALFEAYYHGVCSCGVPEVYVSGYDAYENPHKNEGLASYLESGLNAAIGRLSWSEAYYEVGATFENPIISERQLEYLRERIYNISGALADRCGCQLDVGADAKRFLGPLDQAMGRLESWFIWCGDFIARDVDDLIVRLQEAAATIEQSTRGGDVLHDAGLRFHI